MLEVEYDGQQRAFADATRLLCDRLRPEWTKVGFPARTWSELAAIGFFELAAARDARAMAGSGELAAVLTELGAQGCPGPLWDTVFAIGVLGVESTRSLVDGSRVAVVGTGGRWPWPDRADLFLELTPDGAWLVQLSSHASRRRVLTGEEWAAGPAKRLDPIEKDRLSDALDRADLAAAAYLTGASGRLVADAARYAGARQQFGKPLGDRQAVAYPLAEADVSVAAAAALVRRCASRSTPDDGALTGGSPPTGLVALLSAVRAARGAASVCLQSYGAIAFTEEAGIADTVRRITQLSVHALPRWRRLAAVANPRDRPDGRSWYRANAAQGQPTP